MRIGCAIKEVFGIKKPIDLMAVTKDRDEDSVTRTLWWELLQEAFVEMKKPGQPEPLNTVIDTVNRTIHMTFVEDTPTVEGVHEKYKIFFKDIDIW